MKQAIAITLAVFAMPAAALTPLPPCVWDAGTQQLGPSQVSPGAYAFVQEAGEGFASSLIDGSEATGYGPSAFILQHCPTGQELLVVLPEGDTNRFLDVYDDMVFGDRAYTMRQVAEALAPMGAGARITESEFGSCACDWLYGTGS